MDLRSRCSLDPGSGGRELCPELFEVVGCDWRGDPSCNDRRECNCASDPLRVLGPGPTAVAELEPDLGLKVGHRSADFERDDKFGTDSVTDLVGLRAGFLPFDCFRVVGVTDLLRLR